MANYETIAQGPIEMDGKQYAGIELNVYSTGAKHFYLNDINGKKVAVSYDALVSTWSNDDVVNNDDIAQSPVQEDVITGEETTDATTSLFDAQADDQKAASEEPDDSSIVSIVRTSSISPVSRKKPSKNVFQRLKTAGFTAVVGALALAACGSSRTALPELAPAVALAAATPNGESTSTTLADKPDKDAPEADTKQKDLEFRMESASNKALAETGLSASVIEEITDYDKILEGPLEAGDSSLNRNKWDGYARTLNGGGQMGADILAGTGNFDEVDSQIGRQALKEKGVPDKIIDQLAENDFTGILAKGYIINAPHAFYKHIAYQNKDTNGNRVLGYDNNRKVGEKDVFVVITYQDPETKEIKSFKARFDCSGFIQTFDKATAPVPVVVPSPSIPHEIPGPTTTVGNTTTTGGNTTTTVGNTTTTSSTVPGTTSTTQPEITTTTLPPPSTTITTRPPETTTTLPPPSTTITTRPPETTTTLPPATTSTTRPPETTTIPDKIPQPPATLPPAPTTLPPAPTTLPPAPTTLPPAPTTLPPAPTTLPPAPTTLPPAPTTLPPAPTTLPPAPTTLPPAPTTLPPAPDKPVAVPTPNVSVPPEHVEPDPVGPSVPTTRLAPAPTQAPAPVTAPTVTHAPAPTPTTGKAPATTQAPRPAPTSVVTVAPEGPSNINPENIVFTRAIKGESKFGTDALISLSAISLAGLYRRIMHGSKKRKTVK